MPVAYSYIRFSSLEQRKGDSFRRQQAESHRWATDNGIELDNSLNINDLGTSAYRGKNVVDGGLGAFLVAIENGTVSKGSYLLVENLDRLTRMDPLSALGLLQSIVSQGVTVVTLSDRREYTAENLTRDISHLLMCLITMHRAHEESRLKGERVRAAWHKKKQIDARLGKPITAMTPMWLRIKDEQFEIIDEKAEIIRRIFALATEEGLGQRAIVTRLKNDGVPTIGRIAMWTETSVRRIIQNRAVIGEYQPRAVKLSNPLVKEDDGEIIENYFPPIVTKRQFYYAQTLREQALIPRGPRGSDLGTIFTGLVFCGACGATMRRKGASRNDIFIRLRCSASCGAKSWKYDVLHVLVIGFLNNDLMPHLDNRGAERAQLLEKIAEAEQVIRTIEKSLEKLIETIEHTGNVPALARRIKEMDIQRSAATVESQRLTSLLRVIEARRFVPGLGDGDAVDSDGIREILSGAPEIPAEKVRFALSRVVDKIVILRRDGVANVRFHIGSEERNFDFDSATLMWTCREVAWKTRIGILHPISNQAFYSTP
jgi:DNA invertase Pin-like site-specific DNA recombinase